MKQYLTVDEMKKLRELGLDTSDASMFYMRNSMKPKEFEPIPRLRTFTDEQEWWFNTKVGQKIEMCYSLNDVLEKIPMIITEDKDYDRTRHFTYQIIRCYDEETEEVKNYYIELIDEDGDDIRTSEEGSYYGEDDKSLINAAYRLLVWILEHQENTDPEFYKTYVVKWKKLI